MKRLFAVLLTLLLVALIAVPAVSAATNTNYVVDNGNLLSESEISDLYQKSLDLQSKYDCDVIFIAVGSLDGKTSQQYADERHLPSEGYSDDSIVFLVAADDGHGSKDAAVSTKGACINRITDAEIDRMLDDITTAMKSGDYYAALDTFAADADTYLSYDTPAPAKGPLPWYWIPIAIIIGFLASLLIMLGVKSKLKSVVMQRSASNYVRQNSMQLRQSRDTFLYTTVTKTAKPKENSGSSTHSTGGTTFGGGSRKY